MISAWTEFFLTAALVLFAVSLVVALFRLIKGPTTADRVVAFDAISAIVMCIVGVLSLLFNTVSFLDSVLLIAIISFLSSITISRFIEGGNVFNGNNKRNH
ncbi:MULTISPECIES: monovalent cation/H+ antiporter complex subunit F [unclassified Staphylococcus]|uniref:monovalent cation/H+ antiporter complex subunit F n=1 Tax=unclassified Staphylococcus TaxID=91994 RepID=UPI0021D1FC23|nr:MULTISPECIES: monovalent cation/H+ antiporter complex subunit F [unclassified Staphylococcus]UXR69887.1 monovalent cation/H+ antiporter complex subunit F [Staphylococcus sp. IVB6246]UXR71926.1 monovalent cation/H+ antiporter complex subunit F [Staphylococcus sp. IVB6240]UXR74234.1 monovalent cation/H+ antiporter complex subunit F [Staphylococcus sp. IVB6238]UXR76623.1 monovalent cation/H+ antiporter complex subunit F [Staphylococcus sp. IVB6233]UXR80752.1 monovalent cation/H+ antiporter com